MKRWDVTPLVDTLCLEGHKLQNLLSLQPIRIDFEGYHAPFLMVIGKTYVSYHYPIFCCNTSENIHKDLKTHQGTS
jgi:hypothetical protein